MRIVKKVAVVIVCSLLLSACFLNKQKVAPTVVEGKALPTFNLETFEGQTVTVGPVEDKAVFIDFWGSWSGDSVREMPIIERIHNDNPDLVVRGIHRGDAEDAQSGQRFAIDRNVTYQLFNDKGSVYKAFVGSENYMPVAAFVDKKGIVIKILYGPKTEAQMRKYVNQALADEF